MTPSFQLQCVCVFLGVGEVVPKITSSTVVTPPLPNTNTPKQEAGHHTHTFLFPTWQQQCVSGDSDRTITRRCKLQTNLNAWLLLCGVSIFVCNGFRLNLGNYWSGGKKAEKVRSCCFSLTCCVGLLPCCFKLSRDHFLETEIPQFLKVLGVYWWSLTSVQYEWGVCGGTHTFSGCNVCYRTKSSVIRILRVSGTKVTACWQWQCV